MRDPSIFAATVEVAAPQTQGATQIEGVRQAGGVACRGGVAIVDGLVDVAELDLGAGAVDSTPRRRRAGQHLREVGVRLVVFAEAR